MTTPVEVVIVGRDETGGAFSSAQGGLAKIGQVAMGILTSQVFTKLAQGVKDFAISIVTEAREAAEVQAQLNAVLTSTNGISGVTADMANELANSLQFQSKYTDEAILSGENMLLTFTNIGKDVFPAATQTILDMSAALGQDVTQSAMQLGKALNDPIQGVTALRRVGVQLTDEQEEQVKQFMAVGDVAGAQKVILDELAKEFGGSAKSQVNSIDLLQKRMDNIKETLGTALLPTIDKFGETLSAALDNPKVQAALEKLTVWLGDNAPKALDAVIQGIEQLSAFFSQAEGSMTKFITPFIPAIQRIGSTFELMRPTIEKVAAALGEKLAAAGKELSSKVFPFLVSVMDKLSFWFQNNRPLIEAFITKMAERFGNWVDAVVKFWAVVEPILNGFLDLVLGLVQLIMEVATGDWEGAWQTIQDIAVNVFDAISEAVVAFLDWIAGLMGGSLAQIKATWTTNWNQLKSIVSQVGAIIKSTISGMLENVKSYFSNAWSNIISGISGFRSSVVSAISDIVTSIRTTFTNAMSSFINVGSSIISSIITGLKNSVSQLTNYLIEVVDNALGGVLSALGIGGGGSSGGGSSGGGGGTPLRAAGGDVYAGVPVTVGELGRETFIPKSDGRIIPNGGAVGGSVNNYFQPTINYFSKPTSRNFVKGLT